LAAGAPAPRKDAPAAGELPRGANVGRYLVLRALGHGAMGVVYAAYDPELDRKLAIKLLRAHVSGRLDDSEARSRMAREAQAMARLAHPNVVTVYDVGTHEGQVFVAMEFVEGQTLKHWCAEGKRSWRDLRDIFVAAGRGLAAAHAAELVHRDFKPENVLIGKDGRVRVGDFGLARSAAAAEPTSRVAFEETAIESGSDALSATLTRTGAFLGTPAYMSPEQLLGRKADARADQFSFCVAMYEALYGQRPFGGTTIGDLTFEIMNGRVKAPAAGSKVPAWLHKVILRGLAADPEQRFASMEDLLAAFSRDPADRRRRWLLAAAALVVVAAGVTWFSTRKTKPPRWSPSPVNMDFEHGRPGESPPGWSLWGTGSRDYDITIANQQPHGGNQCGRLERTRNDEGPNSFGTIMQTVDARAYRGKRVRLRGAARVEAPGRGGLWMRADRTGGRLGFFDNMQDRPIVSADWGEYEIVGDIDADAEALNFGILLVGSGKAWLDDVRVDIVGKDVPLTVDKELPAPRNLDFAEGPVGSVPPGWRLYALGDRSVRGAVAGDPRRVVLTRTQPQPEGTMAARITQSVVAAPFRGKKVRIRAAMKTAAGARARLVFEIEGEHGLSFFYDMADAPVTSAEWVEREIVAGIPQDATVIGYGAIMDGIGEASFGRFTVEAVTP
jgi:serine/threonine protein kinase